MQVVEDFQTQDYIPKGCNASFISLIPKSDPIGLHEYGPISLIGLFTRSYPKCCLIGWKVFFLV